MDQQAIDTMRAEFREWRDWNVIRSIWTEAEALEIGEAIGAVIVSNDVEGQAYWQRRIRYEVEFIRQLVAMAAERMRAFEARVRAEREQRERLAA